MSKGEVREITLSDVESYINLCMKLRSSRFWSFRGQRSEAWDLAPHPWDDTEEADVVSLRYEGLKRRYLERTNQNVEMFKRYFTDAAEFAHLRQKGDEWAWLFYAQHYGLKTQLLDWTSNPLVALYFAVENILAPDVTEDCGVVWALTVAPDRFIRPSDEVAPPKSLRDFVLVNPPPLIGIVPRLVRQSGKFSYHPDVRPIVDQLLPGDMLVKIRLEGSDRSRRVVDRIRLQLGIMNIHHASLFPESENVTKYLNKQWRLMALAEHLPNMGPLDYRPDPRGFDRVQEFCVDG
ncbi:MAG: FRG domain-containing protein [Phycisphaerales bacterium]